MWTKNVTKKNFRFYKMCIIMCVPVLWRLWPVASLSVLIWQEAKRCSRKSRNTNFSLYNIYTWVLNFQSLAVSLRTIKVLTFKNSIWRSLCVECFVRISEQTASLALYIIKCLVCLLRGTDWFLIYNTLRFVFKRLTYKEAK